MAGNRFSAVQNVFCPVRAAIWQLTPILESENVRARITGFFWDLPLGPTCLVRSCDTPRPGADIRRDPPRHPASTIGRSLVPFSEQVNEIQLPCPLHPLVSAGHRVSD